MGSDTMLYYLTFCCDNNGNVAIRRLQELSLKCPSVSTAVNDVTT